MPKQHETMQVTMDTHNKTKKTHSIKWQNWWNWQNWWQNAMKKPTQHNVKKNDATTWQNNTTQHMTQWLDDAMTWQNNATQHRMQWLDKTMHHDGHKQQEEKGHSMAQKATLHATMQHHM